MNNLFKIITFSCLVFIVSCSQTEVTTTLDQKAVVESYLATNHPIDVRVTKEIPFSDTTTALEPVSNLVIKIQVDGQTTTLTPDTAGHYRSTFLVKESKTYNMSFDYNGRTISATTTIPTRPQGFKSGATELIIPPYTVGARPPTFPSPVTLTWTNTASDYYIVAVKSTDALAELVNPYRQGGNRIFRERPTQTNTVDVRAPQFTYYGNHDLLLYHINVEYVSLYDDSGNNSLNLTAPYSNVNNGLGIFTGISADTLKLLVKKQ